MERGEQLSSKRKRNEESGGNDEENETHGKSLDGDEQEQDYKARKERGEESDSDDVEQHEKGGQRRDIEMNGCVLLRNSRNEETNQEAEFEEVIEEETEGRYEDKRDEEGADEEAEEQQNDDEEDDDDDDDEDDEEEEQGGDDDGEQGGDVDEEEDGNDHEEEGENPLTDFFATCLRIARNDSTLTGVYISGTGEDRALKEPELFLLGNALVGNSHLVRLDINEISPLAPRRACQKLCDGIARSRLMSLTVTHLIDPVQMWLFKEIENMPHLQCFGVGMSTLDIRRFTESNYFIRELKLTVCQLNDNDVLSFSKNGLPNLPCLLSLNLGGNEITDAGVSYFCQHWQDNSSIQELEFCSNAIGGNGALQLLRTTKRHSGFVKLGLHRNKNIGHGGLEQIGHELPNIGFTILSIQECVNEPTTPSTHGFRHAASEAASRSLAGGLRGNSSLITLLIGANYLGAARMLMGAASVHPVLQSLSMQGDASIGFSGLQWIGMKLADSKLKEIILHHVISDYPPVPLLEAPAAMAAGQALLDGVRQNETLTSFALWELSPTWEKPIQFHMGWNEVCRPLLRSDAIIPAVWPYILEYFLCEVKLRKAYAYMLLREQPWLVTMYVRRTH
jgi:hypothetical protein